MDVKIIDVSFDPMGTHGIVTDELKQRALGACGMLYPWLIQGTQDSMKDRLITAYPFYIGEMKGGTLNEDGSYQYPGDPDLHALVKFETDIELCFVFEYGMVGVINKDTKETWMTRMD